MARSPLLAVALLSVALLAGCGDDPPQAQPSSPEKPGPSASGRLVGPDGKDLGRVMLTFQSGFTVVDVEATGLTAGPHGFHVHSVGRCEPDSPDPADPAKVGAFLSAGGHLSDEGQTHGSHDGDLPSLLAGADGTAGLTTSTDSLAQADVLDDDGSAVMIHELPDNFGNIPERYAPQGPDEATAKTGDSGGRIACAVLDVA